MKQANFIFSGYNKKDELIESFIIEDRTEHEANNEAMHYVEAHQSINDWSLTPTPVKETEQPEQPYYKGKGEHSVNQLEAICSQYKEYVSFLNSRGNDTTPTSKEGLEDGGFTKGEWKVVKLGESWKVKEWAAVANVQYGGGDSDFVILAPVNTATLLHMEAKANAELIVKAVNNFPAMVEIIKQVKFWFDNESTYPPFTGGYRIAQQAKAILTRINKD